MALTLFLVYIFFINVKLYLSKDIMKILAMLKLHVDTTISEKWLFKLAYFAGLGCPGLAWSVWAKHVLTSNNCKCYLVM